MELYDAVTNTWAFSAPNLLYADSNWPNCVGGGKVQTDGGAYCFPTTNGPANCADNDPRPHIAVDWKATDGKFYVNHTVSGAHGTRVRMNYGDIICSGGSPTSSVSSVNSPDPCDRVMDFCTWDGGVGPDGGPRIQDQWGQTVSFNYNGSTPRVVETYYTTYDDPNNVNVDLYMVYSENSGSTWSSANQIALPTFPQQVPWDYHWGDWSDYQSLAPDGITGGFMAVWGGDCRNGASSCGLFSTVMQ